MQTQINIILFICYWKENLFMLRNIASLVLKLWFNYDLFWMFFQIKGANWREEFVSEAEPDGDHANRDMYSFSPPARPQAESSTSY